MPRQYTRKKAEDVKPATPEDEASSSAEQPPADEPAAGDTVQAADDAAGDDDGDNDVDSEDTADPAPPEAPPATADSADNVLYPVDGNDAAQPGPLCSACFPLGWPVGAEQTVGCEHGMWFRQWPQAAE